MPIQSLTLPPSTLDSQWARVFIDRRRELHAERMQAALIAILKLLIGNLTSIIFIALGTVNPQFQGCFVPISPRPIPITVTA